LKLNMNVTSGAVIMSFGVRLTSGMPPGLFSSFFSFFSFFSSDFSSDLESSAFESSAFESSAMVSSDFGSSAAGCEPPQATNEASERVVTRARREGFRMPRRYHESREEKTAAFSALHAAREVPRERFDLGLGG
jgi:hypothetical protein